MSKKKCSLRVINSGKKPLFGTAAQLAYISQRGGWDNYHKELVTEIAEEVYDKIMAEMNKPKLRSVK